jgi:glycine/D-amino acid oxidase-like deaminating enzyme
VTSRLNQPTVLPAEPSWWLQEALQFEGDPPALPALESTIEADVAILGGGYTGLWTALSLRERAPNLRVVIVEDTVCGGGASGKNGGFVHGYWLSSAKWAANFGDDVVRELTHFGALAQDGIRTFCTAPGVDVWWADNGIIKFSGSPAQDAAIERIIATARRLGATDLVIPLSRAEVQERCRSPHFRAGLWIREGATVQPARLARALRRAALERGVVIYENTPAKDVRVGAPHTVLTPRGAIAARDVVLALNAGLTARPDIAPHVMNFSSFMVITEPVPDLLTEIGWTGGEGLDDARMFLHYFRTTPDGRIAMGSGSGPIDFNGILQPRVFFDAASAARAETALRRFFPGLGDRCVARAWGGPIDVSADGLPFFGTLRPGRVHFGCGYSGHGVNATWIGGMTLASLVLGEDNAFTRSVFCRRRWSAFPPEPLRTVVGRLVRSAIIACEEADEDGVPAPLPARLGAAIPRAFGMRVGTR